MLKTNRLPTRGLLPLVVVLMAGSACAWADSVQPIVPPAQVLYGSQVKTITSNSDVRIDTTTHVFYADKGLHVTTITWADNSISTGPIGGGGGGAGVWGSITGTIGSQSDLMAKFNAVGVSTAALAVSTGAIQTSVTSQGLAIGLLQTSVTNLGASTGTIQSQVNAIAVSTGALNATVVSHTASIAALGVSTAALAVSTGALNTSILAHSVQLAAVGVSTGSLQAQITATALSTGTLKTTLNTVAVDTTSLRTTLNAVAVSTAAIGVSTGSLQTQVTALAVSTTSLGANFPVSLSTNVTGNLPVTNLFSGSGASGSTFLSGTGWAIPAAVSSLGVFNGVTLISSPTPNIAADGVSLTAYLIGTSSAGFKVNTSSITAQGNTFNAANQLVKLTAAPQYPAVDGNLITNINAGSLAGTLPVGVLPSGSNLYIQAQNAVVQQSTFNVLSGTITNLVAGNIKDTSLTPGLCMQVGAGGLLTTAVAACGSGSGPALASTQTWTGQNNWTTVAQSTFTGGLSVGSLTTTGAGAGAWVAAEGADSVTGSATGIDMMWASNVSNSFKFNPNNTSTFTVVGASGTITAGHTPVFSNSNGAVIDSGGTAVTLAQVLASSGTYTGQNTFKDLTVSGNLTISDVTNVTFSSSVVVAAQGPFSVQSRSITELRAQVPSFVGELFYCNNCTVSIGGASTGTLVGQWGAFESRTTFPH